MPEQKTNSLDLERGSTLGKYEILRKLAAGGMAEIYLARVRGTANFEKIVVLKRILPHIAQDPVFVQMFLDEARLAATLQHPNIADVYDVGEVDGTVFFTMEYVHGQDVRAIRIEAKRREETVPLGIALAIVHGTAAALDYAHERISNDGQPLGLVHRDVSSSNVMVSFDGAVKLVDFGVADAILQQHKTQTGTLKGKTAYMSPEQCRGKTLDRRSDLFSLGVVMYELTVGRRPFRGETDFGIMEQIVHGEAPAPSTIIADYPPELEAIVMRLLARERDERYDTAEDLLHELEPFLSHPKLWTSAKQVGRFMRALFAERVDAWEKASHEGVSLAEHVAEAQEPSYKSVGTMPSVASTDPEAQPQRAESESGVSFVETVAVSADFAAETVAVAEAELLAAEAAMIRDQAPSASRPRADSVPGVPQPVPLTKTEPVPSLTVGQLQVGDGTKAIRIGPSSTSPPQRPSRVTSQPVQRESSARVASSLLSGRTTRPSQPPPVTSSPRQPPQSSQPLPSILATSPGRSPPPPPPPPPEPSPEPSPSDSMPTVLSPPPRLTPPPRTTPPPTPPARPTPSPSSPPMIAAPDAPPDAAEPEAPAVPRTTTPQFRTVAEPPEPLETPATPVPTVRPPPRFTVPPPEPEPEPPPPQRKLPMGPPVYPVLRQRSRWPIAVLIALLVLGAAGVAGYFVWQDLQKTQGAAAPDASPSAEPIVAPIVEPAADARVEPAPPQPSQSPEPDAAPPDAEPAPKPSRRKRTRKHDD